MKLILNSFLICIFFFCYPVSGETFLNTYVVKLGGIKIGNLEWEITTDQKKYTNMIKLKSKGFLSSLYKFEGEYFSNGEIKNNLLIPKKYTHLWKTKKQTKKMVLIFENNKLKSLEQNPNETEYLRNDIYRLEKTKDPLTSFLQIIMSGKNSLVIDGRRLYTMSATFNQNTNRNTIELVDYLNLWADHKKSKFEKISYEKEEGVFLPINIHIFFDKKIFKLEQY
jgi:hypothetical protein